MVWSELLLAFLVCHLVGDFLLQTDWQAAHKGGGLGHASRSRHALLGHVAVYTLSFLPVYVWVGIEAGLPLAALTVVLVFVPHWLLDDGRFVRWWMRAVKHSDPDRLPAIRVTVDQSLHVVTLALLAILVAVLS